jgi:hypothetical protein
MPMARCSSLYSCRLLLLFVAVMLGVQLSPSGRWSQPLVPVLWQARQDADTIKAVAGRNSDSIAAAKQRTSGQKCGSGFSFDRSGGGISIDNSEQRDSHRERGNALFKVISPIQPG